MFKSLIATCLFTFSCSANSLKVEKPKNAYVGSSFVLSGSYTFKDTFDYQSFYNLDVEEDVTVELRGALDDQTIRFFAYDGAQGNVFQFDYFDIYYDFDDDIFKIEFIENDGYRWVTDWFQYDDFDDVADFTSIYSEDFSYFVQNLVFNFPYEQFLTDKYEIALFNLFFGQGGNRFVTSYTGYYHFNNGRWFNTSYTFYYPFGCYYSTQSYIFNGLVYYHGSQQVYFSTFYADLSTQSSMFAYDNGSYTNLGNIYFQGLLPRDVRTALSNVGQFQFVPDTSETTWYDMMLSVMDAPIYYLTNLLGFKLFGIELFIAFSSLLTLVLVISIIKKVV